jgi:uncharacterized protein (TIGR03000 family)
MVLMAALATATDLPDHGRRGGRGGCYGGGYGACYGSYYGGCYGGWGGCYGGWGGCYGGGYGGYYGGRGAGYAWGGPAYFGGYAYSPAIVGGMPMVAGDESYFNPQTTQSFYYNAGAGNEATIVVHLPAEATLTVDGQPTNSRSGTRVFQSPPLEPGKTYTYTLRAEVNRDGRLLNDKQTIEIRAGQRTEVTLNLANASQGEERLNVPTGRRNRDISPDDERDNPVPPERPRRIAPPPPRLQ